MSLVIDDHVTSEEISASLESKQATVGDEHTIIEDKHAKSTVIGIEPSLSKAESTVKETIDNTELIRDDRKAIDVDDQTVAEQTPDDQTSAENLKKRHTTQDIEDSCNEDIKLLENNEPCTPRKKGRYELDSPTNYKESTNDKTEFSDNSNSCSPLKKMRYELGAMETVKELNCDTNLVIESQNEPLNLVTTVNMEQTEPLNLIIRKDRDDVNNQYVGISLVKKPGYLFSS